ncbi:uncharacterized protein LOC120842159 [Ixodes scapularis]|uniref:uncharacterized protein LOC120842159 n=1 Tax=Ixodes scapularis TaxID=6945 RepID=UPI001A9D7DA0|nr:uncharacterized protein LOC120842159 [Ixodes scapularis]
MRSLINVSIANQLHFLIQPSSIRLHGASGQFLTNLGEVTATVTADGQTLNQAFIVVPHLVEGKLLLGDDFLTACKAMIWGANSFSIPPPTTCHKVILVTEQLIPPRSRKLVQARLKNLVREQSTKIEVSGTKLLYDRLCLLVEPMVMDKTDSTFYVLLANPSSRPVALPSDATVGVARRVTSVEDIELSDDETAPILSCSSLPSSENLDRPNASESVGPQHQPLSVEGVSFNIGSTLAPEELQKVQELLAKNLACFARTSTDVGNSRLEQHSIPTGNATPISQRPHPLSPAQRDVVKAMIKNLIDAKIVQPSRSPLVLVTKKDG